MPKRSFSDITQSQWIKCCKKLGLIIDLKHGKGSHVLIINPINNFKYTIQYNLHKFINKKIFKKLVEWNFNEDDIWDALS